jgi:hypothetical protein
MTATRCRLTRCLGRLTYWVVFGVFDVFDGALDYLLYWLPYYELLKLIFLVWCFLPGTKVSRCCARLCSCLDACRAAR